MIKELSKIAARQDAEFKFSPSSSNETSINLSNEISDFISDDSGEVEFQIYKKDLIKAINTICLLPEVYWKKNSYRSEASDIIDILYPQILSQFGAADTSTYVINILKRGDGRAYLNNLKK